MEENLVGYLLKSLDADAHQQVESALRARPELQARLELLERALAPLAADADTPEPRPGLVLSTLARVAEQRCLKLPTAPPPPRNQAGQAGRHWLRRPDALVAALLLIVLGGIGSSYLLRLWRDYQGRSECANNLRLVWGGLQQFCDNHDGNYPKVEEKGARSVAGIYVPILNDNGVLSRDVSLTCPAQGRSEAKYRSVRELEELYEKHPTEFRQEARNLSRGYAYTLGYRDAGGHHGLRRDSGDTLPIVADRLESLTQSNSSNHGGEGENVLYLGGDVRWCTLRTVGVDNDDIFINWDNKVLAGKALKDTVLGISDASPAPRQE